MNHNRRHPITIICAAFCLAGAIIGASVSKNSAFAESVTGSLLTFNAKSFWDNLFSTGKYLLAAVFLSLSLFGGPGIPILCGLRGFFAAYYMTAVVSIVAHGKALFAVLIFFLPFLLSISAILSFASSGTQTSAGITVRAFGRGAGGAVVNREFIQRFCVSVVLVVLAALYETYAAPGIAASLLRA
ncbi:MAG: stage II sporulation protein M [Oscillospiraceae bacterium]|jgi:hypothetical protein|nr:stage II sporulation protein M [Oscillospiraceae bacterium]